MRKCCFLTMDSLDGYVSDDELTLEPLQDLGWNVKMVSWRDSTVDWDDFEAVIVRTPWDYQNDADDFLDVLRKIDASKARLENSLSIIEWNLDKRYLSDLENNGVGVVPTIWGNGNLSPSSLDLWKAKLAADELIIKPTVSATAQDTFRVTDFDDRFPTIFGQRGFMVQPFIPSIVEEGEFSLFYFNGEYSHSILKSPKPGDFRVQEEHGGIITAVDPEPAMLETACSINELIRPLPLYSRIDLVRAAGDFAVMELELIEPALYFRMDPDSPARFAQEFDRRMNEL